MSPSCWLIGPYQTVSPPVVFDGHFSRCWLLELCEAIFSLHYIGSIVHSVLTYMIYVSVFHSFVLISETINPSKLCRCNAKCQQQWFVNGMRMCFSPFIIILIRFWMTIFYSWKNQICNSFTFLSKTTCSLLPNLGLSFLSLALCKLGM